MENINELEIFSDIKRKSNKSSYDNRDNPIYFMEKSIKGGYSNKGYAFSFKQRN